MIIFECEVVPFSFSQGGMRGSRVELQPLRMMSMVSDGSLRVYPGNGTGGFLVSKAVGSGWNIFSAILK